MTVTTRVCGVPSAVGDLQIDDGEVAVPPVLERCGAPSRVGALG